MFHKERVSPTTSYYIDQFLKLKCSSSLLAEKIFPNTKEITESMSAFTALRTHLGAPRFSDSSIVALDVACGATPRTGALLAHMTRWTVHAVDPRVNNLRQYKINNLHIHKDKIQNLLFSNGTVVVCAVHPHIQVQEILNSISAKEIFLVSIECCVPQKLNVVPIIEYDDIHNWSPKRKVRVWHL